jgi:hypothetical protein
MLQFAFALPKSDPHQEHELVPSKYLAGIIHTNGL